MLYKVILSGTTNDKLQEFVYSIVSGSVRDDRVSRKLFTEYDGHIILSDDDLDEVRKVNVTQEGLRLLSLPFINHTVLTREVNRTIFGGLTQTEFTLRSYFQYVAMQGLAFIEEFEYPPSEMELD